MKVIITEESVEIVGADFEVDPVNEVNWSCRLASQEAAAWAIKRLGEELEKSVSYYRTGLPVDKIGIE